MATRYWVGGALGGNWSDTGPTKWGTASATADDASVPALGDTIIFDASSGSGACTLTADGAGGTLTMTGFPGTLAFSTYKIVLDLSGTFFTGDTTYSVTGTPLIESSYTGGTSTATFAGGAATETNSISVTFTSSAANAKTVTGSVRNITFGAATAGSMGTSSRTIYGDLTFATGSTTAISSTASITTFASTSGTKTITTNGQTVNFPVTFDGAGGTWQLADALTLGNTRALTLTRGTLNLNNNNLTTGAFSSSNSNTRTLTVGTGQFYLTQTSSTIWTTATTTGLTQTTTPTVNVAVASASSRTVSPGSASHRINLNVSAGTGTIVLGTNYYFGNVNFTGSSSIIGSGNWYLSGDLTLSATTTMAVSASNINFDGTGTQLFDPAGATVTCERGINVNGTGNTVRLMGPLVINATATTRAVAITAGTFDSNGYAVTVPLFSSTGSSTRALTMGASVWTITESGATAWHVSGTGFTVTAGTSTINMTSASAKTFVGDSKTYYNLVQAGAGTLTINNSNTFNDIGNTTQPATLRLHAGTTQTVTTFSLSGTAGNLITLDSTSAGSTATLSKASGTVTPSYLSINDNVATGGATWDASNGTNTNATPLTNSGWIFPATGGNSGAFFALF